MTRVEIEKQKSRFLYKLKKEVSSENMNLKYLNNYIIEQNPQNQQNPSGRNLNKNESSSNLKNLQQTKDSPNMNFTLALIIKYCICNPKSTKEKKKAGATYK